MFPIIIEHELYLVKNIYLKKLEDALAKDWNERINQTKKEYHRDKILDEIRKKYKSKLFIHHIYFY